MGQTNINNRQKQSGFTIVELIVVIVVIGILAAITITGYNGIQERARSAVLASDLKNVAEQLAIDQAATGQYPGALAAADGGNGVKVSNGTTLGDYVVDNSVSPPTFCVTATNGSITYKVTDSASPTQGVCSGNPGGENPPPSLDPALVAAYGFNETSGTTFANQVPGGLPATLWPGAQITAGRTGNAVVGTGGHQAAVISGNPAFNTQSWTGMTVSFWVNRTVSNSYDVVTFWNNASHGSDWGGVYTDGSSLYGAWINTSGDKWPGVKGNLSTKLGQWVHVAFTWTGTTDPGELKMYGNGVLLSTTFTSGSTLAQNTASVDLGGSDAAGGSYSQTAGKIDDFRIYNKALTDAEIVADMNTPVP